jgi:heme-degrading monooxygenase HmoA
MTVVTVFRSRLREGVEADYGPLAHEMARLAATMDGFVDQRSYLADDGERVTIVRFADRASHERWALHPAHRAAQVRGRDEFYLWYELSVSEQTRSVTYPAG